MEQFWTEVFQRMDWILKHAGYFLTALAGASLADFLYTSPESAHLRQRLKEMTKWRGEALARASFLVLISFGTFFVTIILQPATAKEAFFSGFTWLTILSRYRNGAQNGTEANPATPPLEQPSVLERKRRRGTRDAPEANR